MTDAVEAEIERIKADPVQMRIVMLCMMQHPDFVDTLLAIYRDALSRGIANGKPDLSQQFAQAVESHVREHAKEAVRLYDAILLMRTSNTATH